MILGLSVLKLSSGNHLTILGHRDLDLGDIDVILSRDTPANDGEQMCQMILKSHNEQHSYGPDMSPHCSGVILDIAGQHWFDG